MQTKQMRRLLFACLAFWLFAVSSANGQPLPCDDSFYLFVSGHSRGNSDFYRIRVNPVSGAPSFELIRQDLGRRVTAAGYSMADQHIYAMDDLTLEVLRIDAAGRVTVLGKPSGLENNHLYRAGETDPLGRRLLVTSRNASNVDEVLFSIRFQGNRGAGRVSILSDFRASLEDMAFDPLRGSLYGYERTTGKLARVDWISGLVSNYFSRPMTGVERLGSIFLDKQGQVYGYGSTGGGEENTFFAIDKFSGLAVVKGQGPRAQMSDGCSCPYSFFIEKTVFPRKVPPCGEFFVTYDLINRGGTAYSNMRITDTLPPGFRIVEILERPGFSTVVSGEGSRILDIDRTDILLDSNRVVIRVRVEEGVQPGFYASAANIHHLPQGLGGTLSTEKLLTNPREQPAVVEVTRESVLNLSQEQQVLCDGSGVRLNAFLPGARYRWSNGDTLAGTVAASPGWYSVTATLGCATFSDSVFIEEIPLAPEIDLGEDLQITLGDRLVLGQNLPNRNDWTYYWSSTMDGRLSCEQCPYPEVRPIDHSTYYLLVRDENNCEAADSVQVLVQPTEKIFAPTAFSPDGDGINDLFYLDGIAGSALIRSLGVFDRWGNQVFQTLGNSLGDSSAGWDGRFRGRPLPTGLYIWKAELEFPDGRKKQLGGQLMLMRSGQ